MKTIQMLGSELKPGMRIWEQGGLYEIFNVAFDPIGNGGGTRRYVCRAKWISGANGDFFPNDMRFGLREDLFWSVDSDSLVVNSADYADEPSDCDGGPQSFSDSPRGRDALDKWAARNCD